ncbi:hypothetical protein AHAS_Ahas01G0171400 [Arachis hypogaea]
MKFQMPKNFTLPTTLKPYEGIEDPNIHITKFHSMMFLNGALNLILCHSFPTFLDGAALLWFFNLSASFISSFEEFTELFINKFCSFKSLYP